LSDEENAADHGAAADDRFLHARTATTAHEGCDMTIELFL
jgi:hypothetical protein